MCIYIYIYIHTHIHVYIKVFKYNAFGMLNMGGPAETSQGNDRQEVVIIMIIVIIILILLIIIIIMILMILTIIIIMIVMIIVIIIRRSSERDEWGQHQWGHRRFCVFRQRDFLALPLDVFSPKCQGILFPDPANRYFLQQPR